MLDIKSAWYDGCYIDYNMLRLVKINASSGINTHRIKYDKNIYNTN